MRVQFGEFTFDDEARELRHLDKQVHITPKAFELLQVLIEERPRAIRKNELRDRLWPDVVVEEANLKNLIAEIRAVLPSDCIRTVQRYGYAFISVTSAETTARLIVGERIHRLRHGDNLIGRDDDCSVVIDFTGISRHHAKIRVAGSQVALEDVGSKNGTWRNDVRVKGSVELQDGDRIRLGGILLIFRSSVGSASTDTINDSKVRTPS